MLRTVLDSISDINIFVNCAERTIKEIAEKAHSGEEVLEVKHRTMGLANKMNFVRLAK